MTQPEFGEIFSVSKGSIHAYENDINEPKASFFIMLYELTSIHQYDLLTREISPSEIPDQPGIKLSPGITEPPTKNEPPMIEEPLYNFHLLVKRMRELESEVKDLKGKINL